MKTKELFAVLTVGLALIAQGGGVLTGKAAVAKFPASLRGMGLQTAKWAQLAKGIEYYYGSFSNLLGTLDGYKGSKNDVHLLRIDYKRAPVKMKLVDHSQGKPNRASASKTAAEHNAFFAINMTMQDHKGGPQGYMKINGKEIPSLRETSPDGFVFNDNKTYAFGRKWLDTDPKTGLPKADAWQNVVSHEAYTVQNGKVTWGPEATFFGRANYAFIGTTANGVLWLGTVDGRRSGVSDGLGYHEVAALQRELGCVEAVCCDGGGSTTLVIRKDLMPVSDICATQKTSAYSDKYYTMNFLCDSSLRGNLGNGSERKTINQLLFVDSRNK